MSCIKCGREIPEGELFCVECSLAPSAEAAEKKAARPTVVRPAQKKPAAKRPVGLIVAFVVVCLIACASTGYLAYDLLLHNDRQSAELTRAQTELAQTNSRYNTLEQELQRANDQLDGYQTEIGILETEIDSLKELLNMSEGSANQSRFDLSEQQLEYDELTEAYTSLAEEADRLTSALAVAEADLAAAAAQLTEANETIGKLYEENAELAETVAFYDSYAVFIAVDEQTYYHRHDCSAIDSLSFWIYNRKLAESKGYTPCPDCFG